MKHQVLSLVMMMAGGIIVAGSPKAGLAADQNYSGKYSAERLKKTPPGSTDSTLEVVQNEDNIEITRVKLGKKTTTRYPFNGSLGDCTSSDGGSGKCKAQLKGKDLIIESAVVIQQQPTGAVRMHTKERWQLSNDAKTLTIKLDVYFPDPPAGISRVMSNTVTTKYTRTENP